MFCLFFSDSTPYLLFVDNTLLSPYIWTLWAISIEKKNSPIIEDYQYAIAVHFRERRSFSPDPLIGMRLSKYLSSSNYHLVKIKIGEVNTW